MAAPSQPEKSILDLIDTCDNFRLSSCPERLVPWRLSPSPSSPVVGLLRPPIVQKLQAEPSGAWHIAGVNGITGVSFDEKVSAPAQRTAVMRELCARWRDEGFAPGVIGPAKWRGEMYPVYACPFAGRGREGNGNYVCEMERSACALFGVVTYGVHMTVYEEDERGVRVWVPTRAKSKPTWPGFLDNSVAGGIPSGMGAFEALVKESMEEASIDADIVRAHATAVGAISYFFQTKDGWLQPEIEFVYDLRVPADLGEEERERFRPKPLDGEVEAFELFPLDEVLTRMRAGLFKPNCALVIIDFLMRRGSITPDNEPDYMEILTRLHSRFEYERWGELGA